MMQSANNTNQSNMNTKSKTEKSDAPRHYPPSPIYPYWEITNDNAMISIPILALDHMGIRISDLDLSLAFYSIFGFELDTSEDLTEYHVYPLIHPSGVRINLIINAKHHHNYNILLDSDIKYSGITHLAFVVKNMEETLRRLKENKITITEGPLRVSSRRIVCFIRDPDGNVLEFNEISDESNALS